MNPYLKRLFLTCLFLIDQNRYILTDVHMMMTKGSSKDLAVVIKEIRIESVSMDTCEFLDIGIYGEQIIYDFSKVKVSICHIEEKLSP